MKLLLKKSVPHIIAIAIFLVLTCIYFSPSIFEGKLIQQGDTIQATGMAEEIHSYWEKEKGKSAWTGSMFSGMPSYHIYVHGNPVNFLTYIEKVIRTIDYLGGSMIFTALICFYILMCAMGVRRWLAIAGSVAFAFASFNLISIMAGHVTKMYVMAYMPLTLAGMVLLFRRRWIWGSVVLALGICFSIMNSHLQITFYLAILCVFIALGFLFIELRKKEYSTLAKTFGVMAICVILAIIPNIGTLYANYELAQESTRGASELTLVSEEAGTTASGGLDIDYAFMWSYGKGELLTLLIPNAYGGASGEVLGKDSHFYKAIKASGAQVGKDVQAPTYWGDQPFTSGPVYFGAIVCFLFVLGMFVIKNQMKWWLAGAALLFIFLSLGRNMSWLNDFLFYHLPMYNKFRTPSMALVISGMIFPIIGFWGLKEIFSKEFSSTFLKQSLIYSTVITGGICLIIWIMPGVFLSFNAASDAQLQQWPPQWIDALVADRKSLASSDAFRSLIFILLGSGLLFYFLFAKNKKQATTVVGIGLLILITVDLWMVDKRYLNDSHFKKQQIAENFKKTTANESILQDNSPSYRVLNLTVSPFQDASTSYFHKSIGGYHAAKLGRYQELIDFRLQKEINQIRSGFQTATSEEDINTIFQHTPSLNMLNSKYIIISPDHAPFVNQYAYGNAWFVNDVRIVNSADEEITSLNSINPLTTAVVDKRFESMVGKTASDPENSGTIKLTSYKPNILTYESNTTSDQIAVFSEIYYPHGWKAFIDGAPSDHYRANWTLRAMNIPAGKHTIEFRFEPDTYNNLNNVASVFSLLLFLMLLGALGYSIVSELKKEKG